jgi:hypothetical protein
MAWQPNIPVATDKFSKSQADLQGNFQALATLLNPANMIHLFPQRGSNPGAIANTVQLYSRADAIVAGGPGTAGGTGLFLGLGPGGGTIPLTTALHAPSGWSFLPSGIIVQWGIANGSGTPPAVIPLSRAFPNNIYVVLATSTQQNTGVIYSVSTSVDNANKAQFTATTTAAITGVNGVNLQNTIVPFFYLAIGD